MGMMQKDYKADDIRNICMVGSSGAGKTILVESIASNAGIVTRMGSVEDGNTVSDYNEDEIERKISINLSVISFEHKNRKVNLIDTPGYADFVGEVFSGINVCEACILVISADTGIDASVENLWEIITQEGRSVLFFINKCDKENVDLKALIGKIESALEIKLTPMNASSKTGRDFSTGWTGGLDLSDEVVEAIASCDDSLIEKYINGEKIPDAELINGFKSGFARRKIMPVIFGSALNSAGTKPLMDFITDFLPPPQLEGGEQEPFMGLVFKTISEPGMGQMNYIRTYSGRLSAGQDIYNFTRDTSERSGHLCSLQGKKRIDMQTLTAGDIGVMVKLKSTRTNDILAEQKVAREKIEKLRRIPFPSPMLNMAVYAKTKGEEEKIGNALQSVIMEDPTMRFQFDAETKEVIVSGMGMLHLEVMMERARLRFKVALELRSPRISYKETIKGMADVQGKFKRQSGGRGQYGDCWLKIEPVERGRGFEFVDKIFGGSIPKNYIPAVEKGVIEAMAGGVIAGYPAVDIRVTVYDGSYHDVDSSDMAFKIAGAMAFRKGVSEAKPVILEPIYNVEVTIPDEYMGSIMGDLNSRRGRVLGMDRVGKKHIVKAHVPLGEIFRYATDLRSLTKGSGKFKTNFAHYEELPSHLTLPLVEAFQKSKKGEEKE